MTPKPSTSSPLQHQLPPSLTGRCRGGGFSGWFFFLLLLLFPSCIKEETHPDTPQGNLDALWTTIDRHYCFLTYKQQTLGLDWNAIHARYSQRLSDKMNSNQLFEVLAEMIAELQDGHVNLYAAHDIGRNWSWYEDHPSNFSQQLQDAYLGTDYKIAAALKYRILPDNIAYLVCNSFQTGLGDGNISEALHYLRTCSGLILDLRDNSGGELTNAQRLAQHFTNERRLVGYISHKTGPAHDDFSQPEPEYIDPAQGVRWQKNTVILTNRRCYSATNTFIRDLKGAPRITILGDQTGGGSGLPFSSELPNGWSVRFSACPMFDQDMHQIEFGIQPDTLVSLAQEDLSKGIDTLIETARSILHHAQ
ncbi:MAG: S41 family peptidase [Bacteroidaceae bacterium]|nr:S41 family peptidase [Bacteroidaceae bacterium]